jgi:hypothetical protein
MLRSTNAALTTPFPLCRHSHSVALPVRRPVPILASSPRSTQVGYQMRFVWPYSAGPPARGPARAAATANTQRAGLTRWHRNGGIGSRCGLFGKSFRPLCPELRATILVMTGATGIRCARGSPRWCRNTAASHLARSELSLSSVTHLMSASYISVTRLCPAGDRTSWLYCNCEVMRLWEPPAGSAAFNARSSAPGHERASLRLAVREIWDVGARDGILIGRPRTSERRAMRRRTYRLPPERAPVAVPRCSMRRDGTHLCE